MKSFVSKLYDDDDDNNDDDLDKVMPCLSYLIKKNLIWLESSPLAEKGGRNEFPV